VSDHLLAVGVKSVIDDPFRGIERVIVLVAEMTKTLGDRFETGPLGLMVERVVGVGAVDDPAKQDQRRIAGESIFFQDCLERAFLAVMTSRRPSRHTELRRGVLFRASPCRPGRR
jgi:hypothetical protein